MYIGVYMRKFKNEAAVAQLVEHHVANVNVTSSSLVSRSNFSVQNDVYENVNVIR